MSIPVTPPPRGEFDKSGWTFLHDWLFKLWRSVVPGPFGSPTTDTYSQAVAFGQGMTGDGVSWHQPGSRLSYSSNPNLGAAVLPGYSGVIGAVFNPNSVTPLTKFDVTVESAVFRNVIDSTGQSGTLLQFSPGGAITCDFGLAGPAANGRDQAGAFAASSWVHVYIIFNPVVGAALIASLTGPNLPNTGPTLPAGYTHWAYVCPVRWNASSNIVPGRGKGNTWWYDADNGAASVRMLTAGVATTFTTVACAVAIPPNNEYGWFNIILEYVHNAAPVTFSTKVRPVGATSTGFMLFDTNPVANITHDINHHTPIFLDGSQQVEYLISTAPSTSGGLYLDVYGYVFSGQT